MPGISLLLRHNDGRCRVVQAGRTFPLLQFGQLGGPEYNGLVVLVVQHDDGQAVRAIENQFQNIGFPRKMTWDVGQVGVYQPPEEILSGPERSIWSVLRLRGLGGRLERYEGGLGSVSRDRIERDSKSETTVGTWICPRSTRLGPRIIASSLMVLVFRAEDRPLRNFASRLEVYFNKRRSEMVFDAMVEQPLYVYIALYQCFNSFTTFFYQYQNIYEEVSLHQEKRITSVFSRSFRLSKTLIHMSYCQEGIPVHKTVLMKIWRLVNYADPSLATTQTLCDELENLEKELDDSEAKYKFFSERFKTALELEFSLSSERLNWILMMFTALTVLFTPIAFVAAVFSFIDSDPVWFLISASAVLCISIVICLWGFSSIQGLGHKMTQEDLRSLLHKLPYQGPDYRRPKGPGDGGGGPPPHDPPPKPHGPMGEEHTSSDEPGPRPSPTQLLPPPSPPPRPPVSYVRLPVSYSQRRPSPPGSPPRRVVPERKHFDPYPHLISPRHRSYLRGPHPAELGIRPGPSITVHRAPSVHSYSSGDSFPEQEVFSRSESRMREHEADLRQQEARLREQEELRRVEMEVRAHRGRVEAMRAQEEVAAAQARDREREQMIENEFARRVRQEVVRREELERREAEVQRMKLKGKMPETE